MEGCLPGTRCRDQVTCICGGHGAIRVQVGFLSCLRDLVPVDGPPVYSSAPCVSGQVDASTCRPSDLPRGVRGWGPVRSPRQQRRNWAFEPPVPASSAAHLCGVETQTG